jgi:hypothetical protein
MTDTAAPQNDGHQAARDIARGVDRLLLDMSLASVHEFVLASGRRADVTALGKDGRILIAEIKSSVQDFRADTKWQEYLDYCDTFYFAVGPDFPVAVLPSTCGIIIADRYGAQVMRPDPSEGKDTKLGAPRRKAVTLKFARVAAARLMASLADEGRSD